VTSVRRIDTPWGSMLVFETSGSQTAAPSNSAPAASDIVVTAPIGSSTNPVAYVEVSGGVNFSTQAVATAQTAFLWAALISALLAAIVGLVVSRRLTTPLGGLSTAAARMSAGDLSVRAPVRSQDEFGQLAGQFNVMAEGLETSFKQLSEERDTLRRFVADASHELRTPITALQTFTDLLQGSAADDPQARTEFLAESQKQLARLEWITRNLLDLSRLEAGIEALDLAACDAAEITRSVGMTFEPQAKEKALELAVTAPAEPVEVRCDRSRVEMALSNLLQNAVKFTSAGGRVELHCEAGEGLARWWVADTGLGISPEDLPHIFERFYRGTNPAVEGSGLGLAIVHSIVQAHGGKVWAESELGQGSKFIIELPTGN
jgi:signal transduction histidine kinase